MKIKYYESFVLNCLNKYINCREDNFFLYGAVLNEMGIDINKSYRELMRHHKDFKLPSFETITRCRRHLQKLNSKLKTKVAQLRAKKVKEFKEYNLSI